MRRLAQLLVLLLVPAVTVYASSAAASATTNQNPWKPTAWHVDGGVDVSGLTPWEGVDCALSARYLPDGNGVEWNQGDCQTGPDLTVLGDQPGEGGSGYRMTFKGKRAGAPGDPTQTYTVGSTTSGWGSGVVTSVSEVSAGTSVWSPTIQWDHQHTMNGTTTNGYGCWAVFDSNTQARVGDSYCYQGGTFPDITPPTAITTVAKTDPGTLQYDLMYNPGTGTARLSSFTYAQGTLKGRMIFPHWGGTFDQPTGAAPGVGKDDPCSVSSSGSLTDDTSTLVGAMRSHIPVGTGPIVDVGTGKCLIDTVCLKLTGHDPLAGDYGPDEVCRDFGLGTPIVNGTTEATGPTANPNLDPGAPADPTTESGFWSSVGHLLWAIIKALAHGFTAVVNAVQHIVSGILGGLGDVLHGLFVPSDTAFQDEQDGVSSALDDSSLGDWKSAYDTSFRSALPGDGGTASGTTISGKTSTTGTSSVSGRAITTTGTGQVPSFAGVITGQGCKGPGVSWDKFSTMGLPDDWFPLDACSGSTATAAQWCRLLLSMLIGVAGGLRILQLITTSVGLSKQINALSFDWSEASVKR